MQDKTIYEYCIEEGIPTANHYSDLYIPVTKRTKELVKMFGLCVTIFTNQVEGGLWYSCSMQFDPYWNAKLKGTK